MNDTDKENKVEERRSKSRIFAVSRVLNTEKKLLGYTLDIHAEGIKMIIDQKFPEESQFQVILLRELKEDESIPPDITATIDVAWRSAFDEEFDQVGGKIIAVDLPEELDKLIQDAQVKLQKIKDKLI
jgi:hypothetical protein